MSYLAEYFSKKEITVLDMLIVSVLSVIIAWIIKRLKIFLRDGYRKIVKRIQYKRILTKERLFVPAKVYMDLKATKRKLKKYEIEYIKKVEKQLESSREETKKNGEVPYELIQKAKKVIANIEK